MITVGLDCEWQVGRPGLQAPPLACVAIGTAEVQAVLHHTDWIPDITRLLEDPNILLVGHYISSDFSVLVNEAPHLLPRVFDAYEADRITCTLTRQKLCDIAGGIYHGFDDIEGKTTKLNYSLEDLAKRHLGLDLDKENSWRLRYGELRPLPIEQWPAEAVSYPKSDVKVACDVWAIQEKNAFFLEDQYRQARASFWLRLMRAWGLRTDERGIEALAKRTQRECDQIAAELSKAGLLWGPKARGVKSGKVGSKNIKVAHQRVIDVYTRQGREVPLTDGGKSGNRVPCTDKVTCEESGDLVLINYARLSSQRLVLSRDIPLLTAGIHYPIHSRYEDLKETGRTGSSEPNVQNTKRTGGIRECFVPRCLKCSRVHQSEDVRAGHCLRCGNVLSVLWSDDYGGLELSTLAQACVTVLGHSRLAEAINSNIDPHLVIAAQILHRSYDELKAIKKAGAGRDCVAQSGRACRCAYCIMSNARQTGKVANFGFPGGLGAAALVFFALNNYDVRLTEDEARHLKRVWLDTWPEMRQYFAWIATHTDKPFAQIQQLFVGRYRGGLRYTEACNTIFQGLGSDIAKAAGFKIIRACYDPTVGSVLYGSRVNNFIHDEFVGESPEPIAHECAFEVRRLMLEAAAPFLPNVKIDVEPALMRRYSKEAGPKYENGRLVPWAA